jgi:sialic acid synthase SpsE
VHPSTGKGWLGGTLLFHLNLSYSSIEVAERAEVVRRCYRPLLALVDRLPWLSLAVEASGHTLERIAALDPTWIDDLRTRIEAGRVELVGSGDTQLIGPLVPQRVHRWNQRLGQETYARLLGVRPTVALVNEMAWSQGIVDGYADAGYETVVMEWNNPRRLHPGWEEEWRYGVVGTTSPRGTRIDVLFADAVAFQKLQRAVAGELDAEEYVEWVLARRGDGPRHLFLYAGDAEIFDHRPGRYAAEPPLPAGAGGEWGRLAELLERLHVAGVVSTTPSAVRVQADLRTGVDLVLNAAADPLPVKKQPKYNATRWALTGRDDLALNTSCFARAAALEALDAPDSSEHRAEWRALCRAWASDLRTHLTEARWEPVAAGLREGAPAGSECGRSGSTLRQARVDRVGDRLAIETDQVALELDLRRGLAIRALRFPEVHGSPLCGTLAHGHFEDIHWAADFYSGHAVLEIPACGRITDLERVEPEVEVHDDHVEVTVHVDTPLGALPEHLRVFADRLELEYGFSALGERPAGSLRAGFVTLAPDGLDRRLWVTCASGGAPERFLVAGEVDHGASVSPLVSARTVFGATDGRFVLDDGRAALELLAAGLAQRVDRGAHLVERGHAGREHRRAGRDAPGRRAARRLRPHPLRPQDRRMSTRFVAEVSSNHGRDLDRSLAFVDAAADLGCAAVKFQQFRIRELFAPAALRANPGLLAREAWELPEAYNAALARRARAQGIAFASTPFYLDAVGLLEESVDFYKIASYQVLWTDLLREVGRTGKPVVLATGMASLDEVRAAVDTLGEAGCEELELLHCVSLYPTLPKEANLAAIETLREAFGCPVGWSDHTVDVEVVRRAVRRWDASMVEFHLDLDGAGEEFCGGHCWLPEEIGPLIASLASDTTPLPGMHVADGDGRKEPRPSETFERSWRTDPSDGLRPLLAMRRDLQEQVA